LISLTQSAMHNRVMICGSFEALSVLQHMLWLHQGCSGVGTCGSSVPTPFCTGNVAWRFRLH